MRAPRRRRGCSIQETDRDSGKVSRAQAEHEEHIDVCPYGQQISIVS